MMNDFRSRRTHSTIAWNGKECVPIDAERIFIGYGRIPQTIERVHHGQDSFPCFEECVHFLFFSLTFFTGISFKQSFIRIDTKKYRLIVIIVNA